MNPSAAKTPLHLWIVAILATFWNAVGAFDYTATQYRLESYMGQFTPAQLDYFYSFPVWVDAAWAIAVWSSMLGSLGLLLRKSWSVWLFGLAILGMALTSVHNFLLSDGLAVMGDGALMFSGLIWVIALFLYFYAGVMKRRGVLR